MNITVQEPQGWFHKLASIVAPTWHGRYKLRLLERGELSFKVDRCLPSQLLAEGINVVAANINWIKR